MPEEDSICECSHRESRHLIDERADAGMDHPGENGDFCLEVLWEEDLKMNVSCLCRKFAPKGSVPAERPRKSPNYEEDG